MMSRFFTKHRPKNKTETLELKVELLNLHAKNTYTTRYVMIKNTIDFFKKSSNQRSGQKF